MNRVVLAVAFLGLAACGKDGGGGGDSLSDDPLSGTIDGQPWTFEVGGVDLFLSDDDSWFISLYGEDVDPCSFPEPTMPFLLASAPRGAVGEEVEFSFGLNATFVVEGEDGPENNVALDGAARTDSEDETTVSGAIRARFDSDDFDVNGTFEAEVCPE